MFPTLSFLFCLLFRLSRVPISLRRVTSVPPKVQPRGKRTPSSCPHARSFACSHCLKNKCCVFSLISFFFSICLFAFDAFLLFCCFFAFDYLFRYVFEIPLFLSQRVISKRCLIVFLFVCLFSLEFYSVYCLCLSSCLIFSQEAFSRLVICHLVGFSLLAS